MSIGMAYPAIVVRFFRVMRPIRVARLVSPALTEKVSAAKQRRAMAHLR